VGSSLSNTLEVEQHLAGVVKRLLTGLSLESAWLCLEPESVDGDLLIIEEASGAAAPRSRAFVEELHTGVASTRVATSVNGRVMVTPLMAESGVLGSLGATLSEDATFTDEQVELLTTVARQVQVAVENARLYRQRQESMQTYVRQVTQAQEDERLRIARELHDETAQELVHLARRLENLRDGSAPDLEQPIDDLLAQARGTLRSVRRFSQDLRPSVLDDLGLLAAIEMVVEEAKARLPGGATLSVTGKARRLDPTAELALFRIAQEGLRNAEKHAAPTSAAVALNFGEDEVRLRVTDDGSGFSPPKSVSDLAKVGKLGVLGMKERAELVGGTFELHSSPGKGTELLVTVAPGSALSH
jgi:signal transduction histidine kinase